MRRALVVALVAAFFMMLGSVSALADTATPYGPPPPDITVTKTVIQQGAGVTVDGQGFCPDTAVRVTVSHLDLVYITKIVMANATGVLRVTVVPTKVGTNVIRLVGRQADCTGLQRLAVSVKTVTKPGLPGTGGAGLTPLWAGLGLLAAGALVVRVAFKRRRVLV